MIPFSRALPRMVLRLMTSPGSLTSSMQPSVNYSYLESFKSPKYFSLYERSLLKALRNWQKRGGGAATCSVKHHRMTSHLETQTGIKRKYTLAIASQTGIWAPEKGGGLSMFPHFLMTEMLPAGKWGMNSGSQRKGVGGVLEAAQGGGGGGKHPSRSSCQAHLSARLGRLLPQPRSAARKAPALPSSGPQN